MVGEDWYRYLAATNQHIIEARDSVEKQKCCIDDSKLAGRSTDVLVARLRLVESRLQELMARRERILKWVRTYPLPLRPQAPGWPQSHVSRVRCPAIDGLTGDVVHMLHDSLVGITLMQMSIARADVELKRSHRALHESSELLERVRKDGF
jgi:hypothetical protein